jgi:hypothetical protein
LPVGSVTESAYPNAVPAPGLLTEMRQMLRQWEICAKSTESPEVKTFRLVQVALAAAEPSP